MAPTAAEAIERVTGVAQAALTAVRESGVRTEDAQTQNLTVQEWFGRPQPQQTPSDYIAQYGLTVRSHGIDEVGPLISAVAAVAQYALRVNGIQLTFSDPEPLKRTARQCAVENARSKATELAETAGVALGPVLSIEHGLSAFPSGQTFARFVQAER